MALEDKVKKAKTKNDSNLPATTNTELDTASPMNVADFLMATPEEEEKMEISVGESAYISFLSAKSKRCAEIQAELPKLPDGHPYFSFNGLHATTGLRIHVHPKHTFRYWASRSPSGELEYAELEENSSLKEEILALLLIHFEGELIPATCTFANARAKCIHDCLNAQNLTEKENWAGDDSERKELISLSPHLRVAMTMSMKTQTAKKSGLEYTKVSGICTPLIRNEVLVLKEAFKSEMLGKRLGNVMRLFDDRKAEVMATT